MKNNNKIFILIDHLGTGGAQQQVIEYLKHANQKRYDITIVNLDAAYDLLGDTIRDLGYKIISLHHRGFFNPGTLQKLIKIFKEEKPAIVHTYLFTADTYGRLAARLAGVPFIICSIRSMDHWKKPHHIFVDKILEKFTHKITINAEPLRDSLLSRWNNDPKKIVKISNGINLERFKNPSHLSPLRNELSIPENALIVGMIGRFCVEKDYETFFEAAQRISQSLNNVYFLAIGDGNRQEELKIWVKKHANSSHIIFTGQRSDTPDLIHLMDIGVLSSHNEGCPNVVLEYMACDKPVVASDVGACSELILDSETGFLIPPSSPDIMAKKITQLLEDKNLRDKMGRLGRKRVEESFSSKILAKNTEDLYQELLMPKIAMLLSQFPETHETFILREFLGLKETHIPFEIFSLKKCRDKIIHPEALPFIEQTHYAPSLCVGPILYFCFRHPLKFLKAKLTCIVFNIHHPMQLIKAMGVFIRSCYFARLMRQRGVTHIHAHWATMPTTGADVISQLTGIPFSFTAHAWDIYLNNPRNLKDKIRKAQFALTCTKANKEFLNQMDPTKTSNKVIVNYHGLDLNDFAFREDKKREDNLIFSVGRLVEQKGFKYLIKACGLLKERGLSFQCIIIGNGPLRKEFEELRRNLNLDDFVEMPGTVTQKEIKELFQRANVFAAPSVISKNGDRDGIPNVILEALAIGVPVVAANVSGIPEVIIDQETGRLIESHNARQLANALERVLTEKDPVKKFSLNGRKMIEQNFNVYQNVQEMVELFS